MEHLTILTIAIYCFCDVHSLIFQTIGIYSICGDNYTQSKFTEFGYAMNLSVFTVFKQEKSVVGNQYVKNETSVYKSFDVCHDVQKLVSLVPKLLLDSEFYAVNQSALWETTRHGLRLYYKINAERSTMIVQIITHIPGDMLQVFLDIMSLETIAISKHSSLVKTTEKMNRRNNFYNIEDSFSDVERYLKKKNWKDVIVLHLKEGGKFTPYLTRMVKMLTNMNGICLKTLTLDNENESMKLVRNIEKIYHEANQTKNFILILIGRRGKNLNYWKYVNKNADYFDNIFILSPFIESGFAVPFKWRAILYSLPRYIVEFSQNVEDQLDSIFHDLRNHTIFSTIQNNMGAIAALLRTITIEISLSGRIHYQWSYFLKTVNRKLQFNHNKLFVFYDNIPRKIESKCYHPNCPPAYEKVYGKVPNGTTLWDEEIGYYCQPCKSNYIKPLNGNDRCQPCTEYFVSNPQKTKCIDPLLLAHHRPGDASGIITFSTCSVGGVLCLFTIAIFIKFRDTAIVMTSDFTMSLVHLTAILLFFSSSATFFISPTPEICLCRTLSIALFYNLNISIIYTKSNKLVKAFSSNIRSSKSEVLKTTLMQAFTIIMQLMSACLLLIALWSHQYPGIAVRLNIEHSNKFLYCNNGSDNIALIGLMLLLQLACFIQAFQCRKLPGHVSEAMNIVYASFIVTVSLCVMFPIQFFQKYEENRDMVIVLVLSGNNMILFLFMYSQKLFIILFRPEKNTKEYFRRKQMEMIEAKARKIY